MDWFKEKGWKICHTKTPKKKKVEMAVLINKIDFRTLNIVSGTLHERKITKS